MTTELAPSEDATRSLPLARRLVRYPVVQFLIVFACALLVSAPFLGQRIRETPGISPQDELSYIDTLVRIQDGQLLMRQGETLDEETLQELGCRGVDASALVPDVAVCKGTSSSDVEFYNTADIDPPVYHWTVAALSYLPFDVGVTQNMITAARLLGIVWCALTMTLIFFLARRLGAPVAAAAAASSTVLWLSIVNIQFQYVTPHSTGALVGAVVALVVASRLQDKVGWWLVTLAALLAATVKLTNLVIVMAGCAAFLAAFAWHREEGPRPRRRLWDAVNLGATAVAATLAWVVIRRLTRTSDVEPYPWAVVDSLSLPQVLENLGAFVYPWSTGTARGFAILLAVAVFGVAGWLVLSRDTAAVQRNLAIGLLASAALAPIALVVMNWVVTRYYVPTQGRYGLSLVPLAVALAASQVRARWLQITLVVVSLVAFWLAWQSAPSLAGS
ncbi:glycosyltransferase family 39 protein [Cellulomonas xylanilytica]|uniref:Uncharacterized protein n=1 Tax=Cellulomonas xylanilytica TaxID=233583 RepID=A0A510V8R4_9CELL|nr:glycosyltransferase family 39 protein [Cellulomonas xylanilytica]GEK21660.1 hypothetical protein CXY01_21800 [Cellulomonas xylanilytica]